MTDTFTIATDRVSPRRWCRVRIHPTVEDLQAAAHRLRPDTRRAHWDGCFGCFHPSTYWQHDETGEIRYGRNGFAGTLRLAEGHVTSEIVAHELVHAALQIYRMNVTTEVRLGRQCASREESLAYIYGELYASFEEAYHRRSA